MPYSPKTPAEAWQRLKEGNQRFMRGDMEHPSQTSIDRENLKVAQNPYVVIFGCSDSRVAAEIIFDQGLGDAFVVRTAGHVIDTTVIGTIEYALHILDARLIIVLGHDKCGAVNAAVKALRTGEMPEGMVRAIVDRVIPSIVPIAGELQEGSDSISEEKLLSQHLHHTSHMLADYSSIIRDAIQSNSCAIVAAQYNLEEGEVSVVEVVGDIGSSDN